MFKGIRKDKTNQNVTVLTVTYPNHHQKQEKGKKNVHLK